MTTESSPNTATGQSHESVGIGRIELNMTVTTHPLEYKGQPRERSSRGVVVKVGPLCSKVRIPGVEKPQTFWNFELEPAINDPG